MDIDSIQNSLTTKWVGRRLFHFSSIGSTNQELLHLAASGVAEGTVVTADEQTAGRGRLSRVWHSPSEKNLYFSLLLRPCVHDPMQLATIPLLIGLAVAQELDGWIPATRTAVKWPNDVWVQGRKICGILCEMVPGKEGQPPAVIVGVGVNVNSDETIMPEPIRQTATSIFLERGRLVSREKVLVQLLQSMETMVEQWLRDGILPFLPALRERDCLYGEKIQMLLTGTPIQGTGAGIASDGGLLLRLPNGQQTTVYSGEASLIRHL